MKAAFLLLVVTVFTVVLYPGAEAKCLVDPEVYDAVNNEAARAILQERQNDRVFSGIELLYDRCRKGGLVYLEDLVGDEACRKAILTAINRKLLDSDE